MSKWMKWTLAASIIALLVATYLIIQVFKSDNRAKQIDDEQERRAQEYQSRISDAPRHAKPDNASQQPKEQKFRIRGTLYNFTGEPLPQERIEIISKIRSASLGQQEKPYAQIRETDKVGAFEFTAVPKGEYYIFSMTQYFYLVVNADTDFDVRLLAFATIRGKVISADGPVSSGKVLMKSQIAGTPFVMQVTSGIAEDGSFAFGMVRPSIVSVCAIPSNYAAGVIPAFEVSAGREYSLEIKVEKGVTFFGTVIDESAQPVADAIVSVGGDYDMIDLRTDAAGRFSTDALDAKDYVAIVKKEGYAMTTGTISAGKDNVLTLVHTGSLVIDATEDGTVIIRHSKGTDQIKVEAGKAAAMQSIPCGEITVDFLRKDGTKVSQGVRLTPDGAVVNVPSK